MAGGNIVAASESRVPRWASRKAKITYGVSSAAGGAVVAGSSIPAWADALNVWTSNGWFDLAVRITGVAFVATGSTMNAFATNREKDEIEVLRDALEKAEASGLVTAASEFRKAVGLLTRYNSHGWTPEHVLEFQSEALDFGKSLFDYLKIPDARLCLYAPGAAELEPENAAASTAPKITILNHVYSTPTPGRHEGHPDISRGRATEHMFQALKMNKPRHTPKRKGVKESEHRWRSSMCLGVRLANEPVSLLTVDSTVRQAFSAEADGVLILVRDLLVMAENEKRRRLESHTAVPLIPALLSSDRR